MAQTEVERANTLDGMLDELPALDSGFFSIPVDDFFQNYIDTLGQRGLQENASGQQQAVPGQYDALPLPTSNYNNYDQNGQILPSAMSMELFPPVQFGLQQPISMPMDGTTGESFVHFNSNGNVSGTGLPNGMNGTHNVDQNGARMPAIGDLPQDGSNERPASENSGSGGQQSVSPRHNRGRAPRHKAATEYNMDDEDNMDSDENAGKRGTGRAKRNAKQQAQNKQAQQRYRERRKQRFTDMEHAIDELSAKLEQMQAIQNQNAMLQTKRDELEAMVAAKDQELEKLRRAAPHNGTSNGDGPGTPPRRRPEDHEAHVQELQSQAVGFVQSLKAYMEQHGLMDVDPSGAGVDPVVAQGLAEMVGRGCTTCQSAMRGEGVDVLRLMSCDVKDLSRIKCMLRCERIQKVMATLKLSDVQKNQLMLLRKNHLQNLRTTYELRQQLNNRAMSLMLNPGVESLEGKMQCMGLNSHRMAAQHTVDLDEILSSIKSNLREEQQKVMEMNFVTMHRIMSPIQAALFLVGTSPSYCDALELANCLAQQLGAVSSSSGECKSSCNSGEGESHSSPRSCNEEIRANTLMQ